MRIPVYLGKCLNKRNIRRFRLCTVFRVLLLLVLSFVFVRLKTLEYSNATARMKMAGGSRQFGGKCPNITNALGCHDQKVIDEVVQTEIQTNLLAVHSIENKQYWDKNEIADIFLNPETARSLKSNRVSGLTRMLQNTIKKPYLLENPDLCTSVRDLKVLVIVHSATSKFENRLAIRQTWTNNTCYPDLGTVRVLFLLGRTADNHKQAMIEEEFKEYGDILQGDFIDSYHNITLKGVLGYKWLTERCRNAKIILKVDDDVIINMFSFLTKYVSIILSKSKHILCRRMPSTAIRRDPNSSWYVHPEDFSGERFFPTYCQGYMASFSNDVIPSLFKSATLTPFFWIDDIYLYGLVPRNIPKINYTSLIYGRDTIWGAENAKLCFTKRTKCDYTVTLIWVDIPDKMREIWSLILYHENRVNNH